MSESKDNAVMFSGDGFVVVTIKAHEDYIRRLAELEAACPKCGSRDVSIHIEGIDEPICGGCALQAKIDELEADIVAMEGHIKDCESLLRVKA